VIQNPTRGETIGEVDVKLGKIIGSSKKQTFLKELGSGNFTVQATSASETKAAGFIEYIIDGWQINLTIAIDYTDSNWDQSNEHSLHFLKDTNQYSNSIQSVGAILEFYDHDGMIPVYGFGAIPNFIPYLSDRTSFCFPLTGSFDQPEVKGIAGVAEIYKATLPSISFSGPTKFAPLLTEFKKHIMKTINTKAYHVL
jgi:hypothetical protein